jgi:hypothetical protein
VLDLDTSFGLSAFGSEGHGETVKAAHRAPEAVRLPVADDRQPPSAAPPVPPIPGRHPDTVAPSAHDTGVHAQARPTDTPAAPEPRPSDLSTDETFEPDVADAFAEHASLHQPLRRSPSPAPVTATAAVTPPWQRPWFLPATAALVVLVLLAAAAWTLRRPSAGASTSGELTINSTPEGARVIIGGKDRGSTPLSLTLDPGRYDVELRAGNERHMVPALVNAGSTTSQHVFFRKDAPAPLGTLRVVSEPPSAAVAVNGRRRGTTPAHITDLPAGTHEVMVTGTSGTVRQRVQVSPGATTTVMVPLPAAAPPPRSTGGWLSITAPTELQVFEGDRLLGTTRVNPLMLPTGTHTLRLTNESAGIDLTRVVSIQGGRTARLQITVPPGTLSVNAVPWAAVSIDGRDVGETPLGGVELTPGTHDVVFTHPELGQRRQQVTVRSGAVTRVSADLRR